MKVINYREKRDEVLKEMVAASKRGDKKLANDLLTLAAHINLKFVNKVPNSEHYFPSS